MKNDHSATLCTRFKTQCRASSRFPALSDSERAPPKGSLQPTQIYLRAPRSFAATLSSAQQTEDTIQPIKQLLGPLRPLSKHTSHSYRPRLRPHPTRKKNTMWLLLTPPVLCGLSLVFLTFWLFYRAYVACVSDEMLDAFMATAEVRVCFRPRLPSPALRALAWLARWVGWTIAVYQRLFQRVSGRAFCRGHTESPDGVEAAHPLAHPLSHTLAQTHKPPLRVTRWLAITTRPT